MSFIPIRSGPPSHEESERRDAARNRERLLEAARQLLDECGVGSLTMDRLAVRAGVGKGTVFRRFGSKAGLMMTLLSDAESDFQRKFMFGPPPLGPGAAPLDRLVAFGSARIGYILEFGDLARLAEQSSHNKFEVPAVILWHSHLEILLRAAGMRADPYLMAGALSATLDTQRILHAVRAQGITPERLAESWRELVTRVAGVRPGLP